MPTIAVLMPCKNAENYITQAIDSILNQSLPDFTLLAIDDGSTDRTNEIIRSYRDPRIHLICSEGEGVSAALNTGLRHCVDIPFAARHDADDYSHPDRFAEQFDYLTRHEDTTVLATQAVRVNADGSFLSDFPTPLAHGQIIKAFSHDNPICHGSVMFRPERILAAGGYDTAYLCAQGYELWVRLASYGHRFEALPTTRYTYRIYPESWSQSQTPLRRELIARIRDQAADLS